MTRAEALEASIEKWRRIEAGTKRELGSSDCPLCHLYLGNMGNLCERCPVYERTGQVLCRDTPYTEWVHTVNWRDVADTDEKRALARAEREFLESLREDIDVNE